MNNTNNLLNELLDMWTRGEIKLVNRVLMRLTNIGQLDVVQEFHKLKEETTYEYSNS